MRRDYGRKRCFGPSRRHTSQAAWRRAVLLDLEFSEAVFADFECRVVDLMDAQAVSRHRVVPRNRHSKTN